MCRPVHRMLETEENQNMYISRLSRYCPLDHSILNLSSSLIQLNRLNHGQVLTPLLLSVFSFRFNFFFLLIRSVRFWFSRERNGRRKRRRCFPADTRRVHFNLLAHTRSNNTMSRGQNKKKTVFYTDFFSMISMEIMTIFQFSGGLASPEKRRGSKVSNK